MARELRFERDGVRLAGIDFGGTGPPILLLHGLAGYAGEWTDTASWLCERARVLALDARGHGNSERFPSDVSQPAHVADAAFAVELVAREQVVVIGQSLGGLTALLLAAERPDLVRAVVLVEAGPGEDEDASRREARVAEVGDALRRWPVPFSSREAAVKFFGGPSPAATAWATGLEQRTDGWWPRHDIEVMERTLREATGHSYWDAWQRISRPTLVVRAGDGSLSVGEAKAMADRGHDVRLVEVAHAKHDVHLDRPEEWRSALTEFLDSLDT